MTDKKAKKKVGDTFFAFCKKTMSNHKKDILFKKGKKYKLDCACLLMEGDGKTPQLFGTIDELGNYCSILFQDYDKTFRRTRFMKRLKKEN